MLPGLFAKQLDLLWPGPSPAAVGGNAVFAMGLHPQLMVRIAPSLGPGHTGRQAGRDSRQVWCGRAQSPPHPPPQWPAATQPAWLAQPVAAQALQLLAPALKGTGDCLQICVIHPSLFCLPRGRSPGSSGRQHLHRAFADQHLAGPGCKLAAVRTQHLLLDGQNLRGVHGKAAQAQA